MRLIIMVFRDQNPAEEQNLQVKLLSGLQQTKTFIKNIRKEKEKNLKIST